VQVKQQLRKMKEKAISRGKWQGSGGPKGAPSIREDQEIVSELAEWEVRTGWMPMPLQCLADCVQCAVRPEHLHAKRAHRSDSTPACSLHLAVSLKPMRVVSLARRTRTTLSPWIARSRCLTM
jgi:hypothetical protein